MSGRSLSQRGQKGQNRKNFSDGAGAPRKGRPHVPWTSHENDLIWSHPDWTARELHDIIPRHSQQAIKRHRARIGRFRPTAIPLCQRCGEHPIWVGSPDGQRWGLCRQCTLDEREWRLRHRRDLDRRDNAIRQASWKRRHRHKG